jgi:hypothetical protein
VLSIGSSSWRAAGSDESRAGTSRLRLRPVLLEDAAEFAGELLRLAPGECCDGVALASTRLRSRFCGEPSAIKRSSSRDGEASQHEPGDRSKRDPHPRGRCRSVRFSRFVGAYAPHLLTDVSAGRACAARRSRGRALADESLETESPPGALVAKMFDPDDVNQFEQARSEASAWACVSVRGGTWLRHSKKRKAVACGQPRRGKSIARCKSTSKWTVRVTASSQA